jgi:Uma2 family endonuclease
VGSGCEALGPDAGLATVGNTVRYPDALVTCSMVPGDAHVVPGVVVVFEVLSPTSGRMDCIVKLREYRAVPSIHRYVILEHSSVSISCFARDNVHADWTATALTAEGILRLPEIGAEIPVAEIYEGVTFPESPEHTNDA